MRRENKGFTLIELIITVAIIAIFSATVVNFVTVGSNSYRNTSKTSTAQMDAQDIMDRIQDLIIDTNCGVGYARGGIESEERTPITNDIDKGESIAKVMMFWNAEQGEDGKVSYTADVLAWTGADDAKLYYGQSTPTIAEGTEVQDALNKIQVELHKLDMITDNLVGFEADISKIADENAVRFKLTVDHSGKQVSLLQTVTLRNRVQIVNYSGAIDSGADSGSEDAKLEIFSRDKIIRPGGSCNVSVSSFKGIDTRTIKWKIVESGQGTITGDVMNAVLNADENAQEGREIKVQASAQRSVQTQALGDGTGGAEVLSNLLTFKVEKTNYVTGLKADKTELLLPAGGDPVDLTDILQFSYIRENDSTDNAATAAENDENAGGEGTSGEVNNIKWSIISPCTFAWIDSSNGKFYARQWAGKDTDSGSVIVRASSKTPDRGITVTCDITINLAHIEVKHPENHSVHFVGDPKYYEYEYYEAGDKKVDVSDINVQIKKSDGAIDDPSNWSMEIPDGDKAGYSTFGINDVTNTDSSWHMQITRELKESGGYGTVTAETIFYVHEHPGEKGELLIRNDEDCVAVQQGVTYRCMTTDGWGIRYVIPKEYAGIWEYTVNWAVTDNQDKNTIVETKDSHTAELNVGENEKSFTLTATYTGKENGETRTAVASKKINVLTDIQIGSKDDKGKFEPFADSTVPVTKGNTYPFYLQLVFGDGTTTPIDNINTYELLWLEAFNGLGYKSPETDKDYSAFWWTVRGDKNYPSNGQSGTGTIRLQNAPQVFIVDNQKTYPGAHINLSVWDETIDATICQKDSSEDPPFHSEENPVITVGKGKPVQLYLKFTRKAGALDKGEPEEREAIWNCTSKEDTIKNAAITPNTGTGGKKYATFSSDTAGEYEITAKFNYGNEAQGEAKATVKVTE